MVISLATNLMALGAQRNLALGSARLGSLFEQLSSGQRINRASDDAAGLSVATSLGAKARVFNQGVRNINDGISALNIADASLESLSNILTSQRELAIQAANGSLSRTQRVALGAAADALTAEYNRIVGTTTFNSNSLLGPGFDRLRIQAGFGIDGSLSFNVGEHTKTTKGTGSFSSAGTFALATSADKVVMVDVNSDGILDLISAASNGAGGSLQVKLGIGDGTFAGAASLSDTFGGSYGGSPVDIIVDQVNGSGGVDILLIMNNIVSGNSDVWLYSGNNNGTFAAEVSVVNTSSGSSRYNSMAYTDFDGDGIKDLIVNDDGDFGAGEINVLRGSGTGTFASQLVISNPYSNITIADFDGDGVKDIGGLNSGGTFQVLRGNGGFSFGSAISTTLGSAGTSVVAGDFNRDGILDIVTTHAGTVDVRFGSGDGTFGAATSYSVTAGSSKDGIKMADMNGDGITDLVTNSRVLFGKSDGSFESPVTYAGSGIFALGDTNGDGVTDIFASTTSYLQSTEENANSQYFTLSTAEDARDAIDLIDAIFERVALERGSIGSSLSRLSSALNTTSSTALNYTAAESLIRDVDVAASTAALVREQILQQATAAILGQANQAPALALQLLRIQSSS